MKKAGFWQTMQIGITLFSMFFGAGNLIFAPYMGVQAGIRAQMAMAGFICTAVILPIAAVIIISRYKDAVEMVSTISRPFAILFISLIYLLIGPCIAIPRTASTSFEMFSWIAPNSFVFRVLYTVLFFAACSISAWKPGRLKDILGKVMGPILVAMILLLCSAGWFEHLSSSVFDGQGNFAASPFWSGFQEGYQTMDILAAFCFGIVILINIKDLGITSRKEQTGLLCKAAVVAGILLAFLYSLLALTGMRYSSLLMHLSNGAQILLQLAEMEFGHFGKILISLIFLFACFNVCSGLLSCCSAYFQGLTKKGSYLQWLLGFTLAGISVSLFGLDAILSVSAPVLTFICPVAIGLLVWGLFYQFGHSK